MTVATNKVADALTEDSDVYAADNHLELVGAATPFGLKAIESMLAVTYIPWLSTGLPGLLDKP